MADRSSDLVVADVWDAPTRWFHWINVLCMLGLMGVGIVIMNSGALGVSEPGKVLLKTTHVWVGYVFALNLLWRLVWAFLGNRYARWRSILPGGRGYLRALGSYVRGILSGRPETYLGHNPIGRLSVTILLLVLAAQAVTGLVLAGTDIFYPPFGRAIAEWIAAPGVDPADVVPYRPELVEPGAYDDMRSFRSPFITIHELGFYVLAVLVVLHVAAVIFTELWEGGTLVSAMFTGRKVLFGTPMDAADATRRNGVVETTADPKLAVQPDPADETNPS